MVMAPRKSVVLVTVDCLRADHCGFMGYRRPTTPFLDGLARARDSFVFPAAIVAGVPTYYSFPAIMASRYPLGLGRELVGLAAEEKSLASVFKENGYATAFFGAGNPYLSSRFGYDFGFDTFRDSLDDADLAAPSGAGTAPLRGRVWASGANRFVEKASHKIPGIAAAYDELYFQYCQHRGSAAPSLDMLRRFPAADVIVDRARNWLASLEKDPFFLWLHFMDSHSPYYPTDKGLEIFGKNSLAPSRAQYLNAYWNRFDIGSTRLRCHRDEIIAMYDSGIRWVDAQIERLVDFLGQLKLWENCIFVLTADHGEEFLEHDGRYHAPSLAEELIHVPLLVRVPGAEKKAVSDTPFSLVHLAPTLLAAAKAPIPAEFQGKSYWKHLQEGTPWAEPAVSECIAGCTNPFILEQRRGGRLLSVRDARYKLRLNFDARTQDCFDLQADPREQTPLSSAAARPERRRLLQAALEHLKKSCARQPSEAYLRVLLGDIDPKSTRALSTAGSSAADWANPIGQRRAI
jgi:arylsulfatase A-like enzyme